MRRYSTFNRPRQKLSKPSRYRGGAAGRGRSGGGGGFGGYGGRGRGKAPTIDITHYIIQAAAQVEKSRATLTEFIAKHTFNDFAIDSRIQTCISAHGYTMPTPIQDEVIPQILKGHDLVGLANTGTGKTAAFLLPLIDKVLKHPRSRILIMAPTHELTLQIEQELIALTRRLPVYGVSCVGGANIGPQISKLKRGDMQFVIGTPGRLKDLAKRKALVFGSFNTVVLDEADRMLDMGFIGDMRAILGATPKSRQTLFFSATMSSEIRGLVHEFLHEPVTISVKTQDTALNVNQTVVNVRGLNKSEVLKALLSKVELKKVLVFGRTKHGVDKLSKALARKGVKVESIHGNKSHSQRQRALQKFKQNEVQALIATDVAARGLDIDGVTHVINYDIPATYDDYVHRIGRTGRGDKKGMALTFVD